MSQTNSILEQVVAIPDRLRRGQALERLSVWLLNNLPEYRQQLAQAVLWDDWPDRDGPDRGVDVVGTLHEGGLWLIQAKAYEASRNLAKKDVDSLIAEAQRLRAAGNDVRALVLVTTAAGISRNAEADLDATRVPWILIAHGELLAHESWMPTTLAGLAAPVKVERHTPFPHQAEAVEAVCRGFEQGAARGQAVLACGTGKTMVGLWVHERLDSQRTVVFVPSILLLSQTLREWARHGTKSARVLAVCSDEGAGRTDEAVQSVHGLCIEVGSIGV